MGCDIHLYIEAKKKKTLLDKLMFWKPTKWVSMDMWELDEDYEPARITVPYEKRFYDGGRNYNLFCALCYVRNWHFTNEPTSISEPKGIPEDVSDEVQREVEDWGSDGHSHNWNTLAELAKFDWSPYGNTCDYFRETTMAKMAQISSNPDHVRIVYFFDN